VTSIIIPILLMFMWCWDYPADHPLKRFCRMFASPLIYFGLWHGWSMFAPEPIHVNRRIRALLTFEDGTIEEWCPVGPEECRTLARTLLARSFKFEHSLLGSSSAHLYAPLCEFLIRQSQSVHLENANRKLRKISLVRDSRLVRPCGSDTTYAALKSAPFYQFDVVTGTGHVLSDSSNRGAATPVSGIKGL